MSLDYVRVEIGLQYTMTPAWDLIVRVPWEQKDQQAAVALIDTATADQREEMQRNIDLHHRSVTLQGIGDIMLLGRRRWSDTWRDGDALSVAAGASLPSGRTIENPYRLGDQGIQHVHIQFGTGTVDPLLEANYHLPLGRRFSADTYFAGHFPFLENDRTFRAPPEATLGADIAHRSTDRLQLRLEGAVYVQGYGDWDGLRDENTGLIAMSATAGATYQLRTVTFSVDLRYPLSQRTLTEGDAFQQGPTVVVSVGGSLVGR